MFFGNFNVSKDLNTQLLELVCNSRGSFTKLHQCPRDGVSVALWGRLDNRALLLKNLQVDPQAAPLTDVQLILVAWQQWGTSCASQFLGDFALAVVDPQQRQVFLARDPLGVKPLYYRLRAGAVQFATSAAAFSHGSNALGADWQAAPDLDWAARYLVGLSTDTTRTAYQGVLKLAPGHWLHVTPEKTCLERYFSFKDDAPPAQQRQAQWVDDYRAVLEESIRCRMPPDGPMATENSGGIDSATITAYLSRFLGEPGDNLHSMGFALEAQEPAYILETSQAAGITHNYVITHYTGNESPDEQMLQALGVLGYPEEHGNATGHIPFYRECQLRGIGILFSGFGGDEVVTNSGTLLRYELLDSGDYRNLWNILPSGRLGPLGRVLRFAKLGVLGHRRRQYRPEFLKAWNARWPHQLLRPEVVARLGLLEAYMETACYDAPYRRVNDFILQHHLHRMDVTTRLENCTQVAASFGVDYRWPLWDVRLVQQYLSTPSIEKVGPDGMGRYLHRRAIDGVVPKRVAWKPSKNMGGSVSHDKNMAETLAKTVLYAQRHEAHLHPALHDLVDREKLQQQIARAQQGNTDPSFDSCFIVSSYRIAWLNLWLYAGQMPG